MLSVFMRFNNSQNSRFGFTLLELVISIGIMAIIGTAAVLVLNPAETFRQGRDINRISDLQTMNKALVYYQAAGGSAFGVHNTVYVSLPDTSPTCANLGLPALNTGWSYACKPAASYRNVDGTGWTPVDFTSTQGTVGVLFSTLPIDPVNTVNGGYYYTYIYGTWTISAALESVKYLASSATNDGGCVATRFEVGNDLALNCNITAGGALSSDKNITAFSFAYPYAAGDIAGTAIAVTVPYGTTITALSPTITIPASASVSPVSGSLKNFSSPVTYTVTAQDKTTKNYIVTVTVAPSAGACGNTLVDARDNKNYNTVLIGSQCWLKQNIDVGTAIPGAIAQTNNAIIEKYCYGDTVANCDTDGGLYLWSEAMQYVTTAGSQGICPTSWHIPTDNEWRVLEESQGICAGAGAGCSGSIGWRGINEGSKLSTFTLNGNNSSGFTGILAGRRNLNGLFVARTGNAFFQTSGDNSGNTYPRILYYGYATVNRNTGNTADDGYSVRCLKD